MKLIDSVRTRVARFLAPALTTIPSARSASLYQNTAADFLMQALTLIPDPDAVLAKAGIARHQLKLLEYDDEISGALETRRIAAVATPWRVEVRNKAGTTNDRTEWVTEQLKRVYAPFMEEAWNALPYGYSVTEMIYVKEPDGRIGLREASPKPMEWFRPRPDAQLEFLGVNQTMMGAGNLVDTTVKFHLSRVRATYVNPYGEAMLSRLYWPWYFRHNAWRFWMQFLERFGQPFLTGNSPEPQTLVDELVKLGIDTAVVVGTDDKIEATTSGFAGEFEKAEVALTKRVQKLILGQTLTTDTQGVGSQALGNVHNLVREDRRAYDIRNLTIAGQWLVNALYRLNWPRELPDEFVMADERGLEADRAERDAKLVDSGIITLTEQYLLERYDFKEGDIEIPEKQAPPLMIPGVNPNDPNDDPKAKGKGKTPPPNPNADAEEEDDPAEIEARARIARLTGPRLRLGKFTPGQQAIEDTADALLSAMPLPIDREDIAAAIKAASSPQDLDERLTVLLGDMDPEAYAALLERALFAADVMGYAHARNLTVKRELKLTFVDDPSATTVRINKDGTFEQVREQGAPAQGGDTMVLSIARPATPVRITPLADGGYISTPLAGSDGEGGGGSGKA